MIQFLCDLSQTGTPFPHCWEHTVGSCHAPLALRSDWQAQLEQCHRELGFRYVRFHGLLSDDLGTLVRQRDTLLDSFFNADQIFDFLLSIGMKPFIELSFMPEALASGRKTVFKYRGNVTPPRDYRQWAAFIKRLVSHWVDRYGGAEVGRWFFEVWNEPNLKAFWTGSREDYFKLYRFTAEAIKAVDGSLRIGGPATARDAWIEEFLDFCERGDVPVDFVSTHHYPTDALWNETMDTELQLAGSRRSILRQWAQDTRRRAGARPLYYTEWNTSSNPRDHLHDEPYAAAFVTKTLMEVSGIVDGYSFWTFSDIFEENYFPSAPFHGGFGLLTLHGIPKPAYRAFQLLHDLGHERLLVDGLHHTLDVFVVRGAGAPNAGHPNAGAALGWPDRIVTVLLTNHALPRHSIETEDVRVTLIAAPEPRRAVCKRIDGDHANAERAWRALGRPAYLDSAIVERLQKASRVSDEVLSYEQRDGACHFDITMPAHAVAAVTLEF
jgi:xylan 1,4-beta-xylosidase